jgi:predicted SAM-dependent methyltransferase
MKIDIGGGLMCRPGYTNLDPIHGAGLFKIEAQDPHGWPVPDASVEAVNASHVLEHIPAGRDRIQVFNEANRVLMPGGIFEIRLPVVGYLDETTGQYVMVAGWWAWADPTHVSYWVFPESLLYLVDGPFKANADYGVRPGFILAAWGVEHGYEGHAILQKVG